MDELIERIERRAGVEPDTARKSIAAILTYLDRNSATTDELSTPPDRNAPKGRMAELYAAVPEAEGLVTKRRGGIFSAFSGGLMGIYSQLTSAGFTVEQMQMAGEEVVAYAREKAERLAPGLDWEKPPPELLLPDNALDLLVWEQKHPDNLWLLRHRAQQLLELEAWDQAKVPLLRLVNLYPQQKGGDSAYRLLVAAMRGSDDKSGEKEWLRKWASVDDEATDAYLRLMELGMADQEWSMVVQNAERYLRVNPLVAPPYRYYAQASAETGDAAAAIVGWKTLLELDVPDKSDAHFQISCLQHQRGDLSEARRHVLKSLEETPRYREALRLLVQIKAAAASGDAAGRAHEPALDPSSRAAQPAAGAAN